jgi:capsular exopolysaccharide synthesis family protein
MAERLRERRALIDPATAASEPFRTLRLALQLHEHATENNIILVTSAEPQAGKSTVACNYALVSSLRQSSVLLIDADLRAPTIHECFGVARTPGLVDVFAAEAELEEFVQRVPGTMLDVLTAGRPIPRSGDLASSARMAELLRQAAERYDLVVVDSPPVLAAADAEGIASHPGVDVLVVVRRSTRRRALTKALRRLRLIDAHVAGTVLNQWGHARGKDNYY